MSLHSKNKFKVKTNSKGQPLSETIGKGIDKIHEAKALAVRSKLIGIQVTEFKKESFKLACEVLGVKQTDVLNSAIDSIIKKATK
tara:strand:- start:1631 stop:1885 length:255 start_codon:yes stop_codon:yes gene_type:complete